MKFLLIAGLSLALWIPGISRANYLNYDANHCEIYVDSFSIHRTGHYGIPATAMVSRISTHLDLDDIQAIGQWIKFKDNYTGEVKETIAWANLNNVYDPTGISFILKVDHPAAGTIDRDVIEFSYFVEVQEGKDATRLWQSHQGTNFNFKDVMAEPTYFHSVAYGQGEYSNELSPLFYQKKSCAL